MVKELITTVRRAATWDDIPDLFLNELADWSEDEDPLPYVLLTGNVPAIPEPGLIGRSFGVFPKLVEPAQALFVTCGEIIAVSDWPEDGSTEDSALLRTFVPRRFPTEAVIEPLRVGRSERCLLKLSVEGHQVLELGFSRTHEEELRPPAIALTGPFIASGCGELTGG